MTAVVISFINKNFLSCFMEHLIEKVEDLKNSDFRKTVDRRLDEFRELGRKSNKEWFSELCFCLLTANTSAELGIRIQKEFGYRGFTDYKDEKELAKKLKDAKYRFYNRRAHFIDLANRYTCLKDILHKQKDMREWLVENIKGIGYKEASHFLRNIGFFDYAILDKHILRILAEEKLIDSVPNSLNRKRYLEYEKILHELCRRIDMTQGELDLYLWYLKTGKVLK
jgi:N-glycosylase/DNA lyase